MVLVVVALEELLVEDALLALVEVVDNTVPEVVDAVLELLDALELLLDVLLVARAARCRPAG